MKQTTPPAVVTSKTENTISFSSAILNRPKRKLQEKSGDGEYVDWKSRRTEYKEKLQKWDEAKSMTLLKKRLDREKIQAAKEQEVKNLRETQGRDWTVSIALPGSIVDNAQSQELRTYLAGQVARAAAVFCVDEVVVFDESKSTTRNEDGDVVSISKDRKRNGCVQLAKILQYLECPQYLRKSFFPPQPDLQYAGLLNPLDAPHHLRADAWNEYREGVVCDKISKEGKGSYVDIGLSKGCQINKRLLAGVRVTVRLDKQSESKKKLKGEVVSPQEPRLLKGQYWGYRTRLATCLNDVFTQCPYKEGYDVTIGTSERGQDVDTFTLPKFKHLLVVFGGVKGLECALESDDDVQADDPSQLFNHYLNTCPTQGSNTIRTEEAVLVSLSALRPKITSTQQRQTKQKLE